MSDWLHSGSAFGITFIRYANRKIGKTNNLKKKPLGARKSKGLNRIANIN
jgi:hypothetical protein